MDRYRQGYLLTAEPGRVDVDRVHASLSHESTDLGVLGVQRFHLAAKDAHELYRRCGFSAIEGADRWMEIDLRPTRAAVLGVDPAPMPTRDQP